VTIGDCDSLGRSLAPIVLVTGLPRSGTSLMMQLLAAAGFPILKDDIRAADTHNPRGYFEYTPVKRLHLDNSWLPTAAGKAVKVVSPLLGFLPTNLAYRAILVERSLTEVVDSQAEMLRCSRKELTLPPGRLKQALKEQQEVALARFSQNPQASLLRVCFRDVFDRPEKVMTEIFKFVGYPMPRLESLVDVVDSRLYRNRSNRESGSLRPGPGKMMVSEGEQKSVGKPNGIVVVSVPKSGTNFLASCLSRATGWRRRWGRPSRDIVRFSQELPPEPDRQIFERATHLIGSTKDLKYLPPEKRPSVFGGRTLTLIDDSLDALTAQRNVERQLTQKIVMSEHPIRSIAYWLRNPSQVPLLNPSEVVAESNQQGYVAVFLTRDFRDVVNSLAHFLHAGTRYVQFKSWHESIDVVLQHYAPVLAQATRLWKSEFKGRHLAYEDLCENPAAYVGRLVHDLNLPNDNMMQTHSDMTSLEFTHRKGGSGDWVNHLSPQQVRHVVEMYSDLLDDRANLCRGK